MRVVLDIPDENLERLGHLAKFQKRSRKAFMELVLITHAESADEGYPKDVIGAFHQKADKQVDELIVEEVEKSSKTRLPKDKKPKEAPKPPISTNSEDPMPVKQEGEDALDFAVRKNEWKKRQNK